MNYEFAALDFFIDKNKELYFIEANSSPGALKEYIKAYKHCKPIKILCNFFNKKGYKKLAVISKRKWEKSIISNEYKKLFKGKIIFCPYKKNKAIFLRGDGHLIDKNNKKIIPDVILRVATDSRTKAQEKAGIKIINPYSVTKVTMDKIKAKKAVIKHTDIKVPKYFLIKKKADIKKILNKNKKLFSKGFVLKPRKGEKSRSIYINKIPKKLKEPFILEELIESYPLFKDEFFEVRSMAVNGKYAGSMLFVSPKRPMHLFTEGRTVKTPKHIEKKIKTATEQIVRVIENETNIPKRTNKINC